VRQPTKKFKEKGTFLSITLQCAIKAGKCRLFVKASATILCVRRGISLTILLWWISGMPQEIIYLSNVFQFNQWNQLFSPKLPTRTENRDTTSTTTCPACARQEQTHERAWDKPTRAKNIGENKPKCNNLENVIFKVSKFPGPSLPKTYAIWLTESKGYSRVPSGTYKLEDRTCSLEFGRFVRLALCFRNLLAAIWAVS